MARPADLGIRADAGLPAGMAVELDADTRQLTADVLFGGSPARVVRLSAAGREALAELRSGTVTSAAGSALAGRLADTGLAHPRPAPAGASLDVTIVIPVRDRAAELDQCLAAAGSRYPVLVADDGSADPAAVAAVCAARGARLLRREVSGGPGPARNTALAQARTEFVAFVDSDCIPPPGWIDGLAGHFADPLLAAVAPRIVAAGPARPAAPARGESDDDGAGTCSGGAGQAGGTGESGEPGAVSSGGLLDLGGRAARVAPLTRVSYVPTAALLVRRAALGDGFDAALRHGEDVDLVWRLTEAGWRVRYEPSVQVAHADPAGRRALLARRFRYGTSAAPLARRHPGALTPLIWQPWPAVTMAALLARRPVLAGAAFGASAALLARRLRASGLPAEGLARPMASGVWQTWLGTGRWCGQFAAPAVLAVLARPGGSAARTRWGRRAAAASLLAGPPLTQWARDQKARGQMSAGDVRGALRQIADTLADQAAYGAGVYAGCLRERTLAPVLPVISRTPVEGLRSRREASQATPARRRAVPGHPRQAP